MAITSWHLFPRLGNYSHPFPSLKTSLGTVPGPYSPTGSGRGPADADLRPPRGGRPRPATQREGV